MSEPRDRRNPYQYSPEEIGEALALLDHNGGNALRTARELRIPRTTLLHWVANAAGLPAGVDATRRRRREEFAHMADEASEWIISSLTPEDMERATLQQKSVSYGIMRDKAAQDDGGQQQPGGGEQDYNALAERMLKRALDAGMTDITLEAIKVRIVQRIPTARACLLAREEPGGEGDVARDAAGIQTATR